MKIKDGFILRTVAGSHIIVAVGEQSKTFNKMVKLNDTAAFLFEAFQNGSDEDAAAKALAEKYNVDLSSARTDTAAFISSLKEAGLLVL